MFVFAAGTHPCSPCGPCGPSGPISARLVPDAKPQASFGDGGAPADLSPCIGCYDDGGSGDMAYTPWDMAYTPADLAF